MLTKQRHEMILKLLEEKGSITVTEIRDLLKASESTVRRDITALDKEGRLVKVFGGAIANKQSVTSHEYTVCLLYTSTQMTFGFSRDDAGKFLDSYYKAKIYESDPFARLDQVGVGQLVKMAAEKGRATRPNIKLGICGEHGGDPSSVEFCHKVGLTYVSCSPFRVPIARLAAAQAALNNK